MNAMQLSWYQALQLLALGPCLFMIFFLCVASRHTSQIVVPVIYFLALSCSFLLPLRELMGGGERAHALLLIGTSVEPAASFLLIVQCMTHRVPKAAYWAILAVPLIGGGQIIYASTVTESEVCLFEQICTQPLVFRKLYDIFSISLTCLLTLVMYRRLRGAGAPEEPWRMREKYALVLAMLALNLALLAIDLARISGYADIDHVYLAKTVVRIGFIYIALTLLFRIFDRPVEIAYDRVPNIRPEEPTSKDTVLVAQIRALFEREKLHRDAELNREKLARKLTVTEATLSRVVNMCFHENVSMLINHYRVEEAKERLAAESTAITVIAFDVGFSSIPSFNRVFKQFAAMSPSAYRQSEKGKAI